jgi:peptide/nickel transport system substrate-binding protein
VISIAIQIGPSIHVLRSSYAQEWELQKPRGTLRVVDFLAQSTSTLLNYAEGLVNLDRDNNVRPCLAKDWRWIDDRTIEFKLREDVRFHNGEKFNAEAVKINWEQYRKMDNPRPFRFLVPPDETVFDITGEYRVRFTFPEPDGLLFVKFQWFVQIAPAFFRHNAFPENNWGYFLEPGPWGTGPFKIIKGSNPWGTASEPVILEAYEEYWNPEYPRVKRVIFDNALLGDRSEATRLCTEQEGTVDIVSLIRPLDTLRVAESRFAGVIKSRDVTTLYGVFNMRKKDSHWQDIRLRKAVNYAINREELRRYGAKGNAYNLGGSLPPGSYGYVAELERYSYDTLRAETLLAQAGFDNGLQVQLITSKAWGLEARIIGRMLERVGFIVEIEILPLDQLTLKRYIPLLEVPPEQQDWDIVIVPAIDMYGHTGASWMPFNSLKESEWRWVKYDPILEVMFRKMASTSDKDKQEEIIRQWVRYTYEQAYHLELYSPITLYAVNKEVNFIPQKCGFLRLKETSVTENHWSRRGKND